MIKKKRSPNKSIIHFSMWVAEIIKQFLPNFDLQLKQAGIEKNAKEYLANAVFVSFLFLLFTAVLVGLIGAFLGFDMLLTNMALVLLFLNGIYFASRLLKPRSLIKKRLKSIEGNLIPAMQSMSMQLSAGTPLFEVMVNIAESNYGEVSTMFGEAVNKMSLGDSQLDVLNEMATNNPSKFFGTTMSQISNALSIGGKKLRITLEQITASLSEEKINQISIYGTKLGALSLFFMLFVVVIPVLGVVFLTIGMSFIQISPWGAKAVFIFLMAMVIFLQIIFNGLIDSKRPTLIEENA